MSRKNQDILLALRMASDLVMVIAAWELAYWVRFSGVLPITKGVPDHVHYIKLLPFIGVVWFAIFAGSGFYRRTGRHRSAFLEALDIMQSCALATLGFIAFTYLYENFSYSRATIALFVVMHPWLIIAGRSIIRKCLRYYRRKAPPRRAFVVGAGDTLRHALDMAAAGDLTRGQIQGAILVGDAVQLAAARELCAQRKIAVYEQPKDWASFFSKNPTESVVIAVPHRAYDFLDHELDRIADQVPDVMLIPDLLRVTRFAAGVDVIQGTPVVTINESPLAGLGSVVKRAVDIFGALVAIVLFSPIMLVTSCAVLFTSRGPILYKQERMGLDGKTFGMLKFRSMPVDAEQKSGAVWAKAGDDRATPVGKLLRRTSLDELPQFFNVLKGDMSLVGPRPERPVFVEQFRRDVPGYYLRHKTKAGITGWAQVNGWRGNTSIEKRIECDLYYIQNWSLIFDLRIIILTIFKGFIHKNAY